MKSCSVHLSVTPVLETIQTDTLSLKDCFSINFQYTHLNISSASNDPKNLMFYFTTPIFDYFLIRPETLCNFNAHANMNDDIKRELYDNFDAVPSCMLDTVLCNMRDRAKEMVAYSEKPGLMEINVLLRIVTTIEEDCFDQFVTQNLGLPATLDFDTTSPNSKDYCSICFGEFCNASWTQLFYTRCSHIFHKECIAKWIYRCVNGARAYSCPLCRCEII
ncbi:hypothetical protein RYX36_034513 [Vicia faba]